MAFRQLEGGLRVFVVHRQFGPCSKVLNVSHVEHNCRVHDYSMC